MMFTLQQQVPNIGELTSDFKKAQGYSKLTWNAKNIYLVHTAYFDSLWPDPLA